MVGVATQIQEISLLSKQPKILKKLFRKFDENKTIINSMEFL